MSAELMIREHLEDCENALESVFLCGFTAANDTITGRISELADVSEQYGLAGLGSRLKSFNEGLLGLRHSVVQNNGEDKKLIALYCDINRYVELALRRCRYDEAKTNMCEI